MTTESQTPTPTPIVSDPFAAEQASFQAELDAATAQIAEEYNAEMGEEDSEGAGEAGETPTGPDATPPDGSEEISSEDESHEEDGDGDGDDDPGVARGMDRLVAREVALQAKEKDIAAREERVKALEAEALKFKGLKPVAELREQIALNPTAVVESLGGDPGTVIKLMLAEQLGDQAPPALKEFAKEAAHNRRIAALEAQLANKQRAEEGAAYFRAIDLGAREYVKTVGEKDMPTLAALIKAAPDEAHSEIMEEIAKDARARAAQEPDGEALTYAEAARRVEGRLAKMRKYFAPDMTATTQKKPEAKKKTPPLSAPKPARELLPWQRQDDLMEAGLKEAMREFHVQEAAAKAKRK